MLTVQEALELPVFATAQVVAGRTGLNNQIRWVHIVDVPGAWYRWGRPGVLLLTAGLGLHSDPDSQTTLISTLVEQNFAGVVLATGYYFQQTPQSIRDSADRLGFPVIEIPPEVLFINVTEAIFEQIVNRQYALLQQSTRIHRQLTELVLQGGHLDNLVQTLAHLLGRSVFIEDPTFYVLAAARRGVVDEAWRSSASQGRAAPELIRRLLEAGVYEQLLKRMALIPVASMPDLGLTLERAVVPIIVGREIYGRIWVVVADEPLTDLDKLTLEHGATVTALIMFKEQAVREAEEALRGDFFEQLLQDNGDAKALADQARQLNYRLGHSHQALLIAGVSRRTGHFQSASRMVETWLRHRHIPALMVWRDDDLVVIIESNDGTYGQNLARGMLEALSHPAWRIMIGVGRPYAPENNRAAAIRRSYEEAQEAVQVSAKLGQQTGVVAFDALGLLHWLYHLSPEQQAGNIFMEYISTLIAYDAKQKTDLVKTLEIYLETGRSLVDAAKILHVHRNTLVHRLERIKQLCQIDLQDPVLCLNLHVAVKSYRLHQGPTEEIGD